ncbi:protoporphyrinogen oxidase HemJ [Asaia bogorensis]|uniref:protoporphyrinogen oxidase HemJ n=1 Tax=Asaia bogorensis TaxID=91915 RepID=UPI000EFA3BD7|nr:protoporphyrinogen oxidase HemJ [Asaia bogorensis]
MSALLPWFSWLKVLHILAFTSWMAGNFYLPRLFVYHSQVQPGTPESDRFQIMERRLLRAIMTPAMIATLISGGLLASLPGVIDWSAPWWWIKLVTVLLLCGFHGFCARWRREFSHDLRLHPERYYRIANEVPTLLMIVIVIMIVARPFSG